MDDTTVTATDPPLLTPEQVARQLAISENTLMTWRCTGRQRIPFVKIGGAVRYRPADVAAYVESRLRRAA